MNFYLTKRLKVSELFIQKLYKYQGLLVKKPFDIGNFILK